MANYRIIQDEKVLADFIDWLPELREGEAYYVVLLARNKYVRDLDTGLHIPHIRSDKQQLARFISDKKSLRNRIKQLEVEVGEYRTRDGEPIPQEALALYITVNPRSHIVAAKESIKMLVEYITKPYAGYRVDQDVISTIQKSLGHKVFMDLDFDGVDVISTFSEMKKYINTDALTILKTRGGFHVLVELDKITSQYIKSWYKGITSLPGVDVKGDNLIPVPGSRQGMFMPYFIDILTS